MTVFVTMMIDYDACDNDKGVCCDDDGIVIAIISEYRWLAPRAASNGPQTFLLVMTSYSATILPLLEKQAMK